MDPTPQYSLKSPSTPAEWSVYHDIRRRVLFENRGRFGMYNESHPDEVCEGHYPLLLVCSDEAIGVIRVDVDQALATFRRVAVREDVQRLGYGRILLSLAEAFARAKGCDEVRSYVDSGAVGFYERCGFARVTSEPGSDTSVLMQKHLGLGF